MKTIYPFKKIEALCEVLRKKAPPVPQRKQKKIDLALNYMKNARRNNLRY
jgi:hypothetical protein